MRFCLFILPFVALLGCFSPKGKQDNASCIAHKTIYPKYSKRFVIRYFGGFKTLSVIRPEDSSLIRGYVIFPKGKETPKGFEHYIPVDENCSAVVCLSTTHVAALCLLNQHQKIAALANASLVYDTIIQQLVQREKIQSIGKDFNPDIEKIILMKPNMVFSDAENGSGIGVLSKIQEAQIPLIISNDYKEQSPLARAEWIKFFAFFLNQESKADSIFNCVEQKYNNVLKQKMVKKPTVFCNYPYQGVWYTPAQYSYFTQLINDAGGHYIFNHMKATNGLNLSLNFEQVFQAAQHADIWLLTSADKKLQGLQKLDEKFSWFDAYKQKHVYSAANRCNVNGGIDYWESACFLPQLVVSDLNKLFSNPDVPADSLFYFKRLE